MPETNLKQCPRCHDLFECKVDPITGCQCSKMHLNGIHLDYIHTYYGTCLCETCLETSRMESNLQDLNRQVLTLFPG